MDLSLSSLITSILFSGTFILTILHLYFHKRRQGRLCNLIPGPKSYPIIGNTLNFAVHPEDAWNFLLRTGTQFYPVWKIWVGFRPVIGITHPDDIQIALSSSKHIEKGESYRLLHPWLQDGLITSTGEKWRSRRKLLTPAFHLDNLKKYIDCFNHHTNSFINRLKSESDSTGIIKELFPLLTTFTINIIVESTMGKIVKEIDMEDYKKSVLEFGETTMYRAYRPWLENEFMFKLTSKGQEYNGLLKKLHNFTEKIIDERKQYYEETVNLSADQIDCRSNRKDKQRKLAFLDILLSAAKQNAGVDEQGVKEEIDTFVFAGHDTVATALQFTILLLAEHQDIQNRVRAEIEEKWAENNGQINFNNIQQLTYLECCIKETLRLYPSVTTIARKTQEDFVLKNCIVPKDTLLNIGIIFAHRNPNFWPRPNVYDPDRFLPENSVNRHPYSFIPFSAGPRNCIGQKFAMLQLKTFMAGLLYNFYLEPQETTADIRLIPDIVVKPSHPVYTKFVPIMR